jgi:hypothetical protein
MHACVLGTASRVEKRVQLPLLQIAVQVITGSFCLPGGLAGKHCSRQAHARTCSASCLHVASCSCDDCYLLKPTLSTPLQCMC